MKKTILVVDDRERLCESLTQNFEEFGYQAFYATSGKDALDSYKNQNVHVVLLDIMLGEESGIDVLEKLLNLNKDLPVIMITGYASVDTAVRSLKIGAFDYVKKPLDFEKLLEIVENAFKSINVTAQNSLNGRETKTISRDPIMLQVLENAKKLAESDLPVLIEGENGTGKEVLADYVHFCSLRKSQKIQKVNCAAFPESLLDNELFGHEKGAYTGAIGLFKGVFERAHKSSLFLDEIGDMPLSIQAKILRTLQNNEIRRIGGQATINVDVRFIAATNKDLKKLISQDLFREDLLYRLNTAIIKIPPLRERKQDINQLAEYFLHDYSGTHKTKVKYINDEVKDLFSKYHWPGNIRELKNVVSYAAAISATEAIEVNNLPIDISQNIIPQASGKTMDQIEIDLIEKTLAMTDYNKKKTAELLKMNRKTLYNKLKRYGIITQR
jgi:two-component system, NtrC family, response regulator AtoC